MEEAVTETASTASATASSSRVGSKRMLGPTAMTRRVIGGRVCGYGGVLVGLGFLTGRE